MPAVLQQSSGFPPDDDGTDNSTAVPPFASCGISDSCRWVPDISEQPSGVSTAPPPPEGRPSSPPLARQPSPPPGMAPSPPPEQLRPPPAKAPVPPAGQPSLLPPMLLTSTPPPTLASPPDHAAGLAQPMRLLAHGNDAHVWCHQQPLPGADCATTDGEEFSCVAAPSSRPHTSAIDYRFTCIPTASVEPVA